MNRSMITNSRVDAYNRAALEKLWVSCIAVVSTSMDIAIHHVLNKQVAQLSQRGRAAGWVSFGQKWKTGTGRQYVADIIGLSLTTVM